MERDALGASAAAAGRINKMKDFDVVRLDRPGTFRNKLEEDISPRDIAAGGLPATAIVEAGKVCYQGLNRMPVAVIEAPGTNINQTNRHVVKAFEEKWLPLWEKHYPLKEGRCWTLSTNDLLKSCTVHSVIATKCTYLDK
jgi:hypothetical protein